MNILIPDRWLREYLITKATPSTICEKLSLAGPSIERIKKIEGEPVYDIEVTTNRVDLMSVYGIAREAATILPELGFKASLKPLALINDPPTSHKPLAISIKNNPELCHRILAIQMSVTKVGPSPAWLQKRLLQVGTRPLNNLIDITNYVMWEVGHPIHVFDYDRLDQKTIIVRQAKPGEKFTTLDNKTHTTRGGEVVFDDGSGTIIDLPGIMGTQNTVVTDKTKNILVWIESVPAPLIRTTSMSLAIRSQAAVLNEKSVDPNLGETAIRRAINLYTDLAGATATSQLVDIYPKPPKIRAARLAQAKLTTYLGTNIDPKRVTRILENLGCTITYNLKTKTYKITPPSSRAHDLQIPEDYIEEIARIYGYHNLGSQVMSTAIPDPGTNFDHHSEHLIKKSLVDWGATEIYTYSLVSAELAQQSDHPLKDHLKLNNPLTDDLVYLRRSLIPSHLQFLDQNRHHQHLTVFELANTYVPGKAGHLPTEKLQLLITTNESFSKLKGLLDALIKLLRVPNYHVTPGQQDATGTIVSGQSRTRAGQTTLGTISPVAPGTFAAQLDLNPLLSVSLAHPTYTPIPNTAPIIEDLTFELPPQTAIGPIIDLLTAQNLVVKVSLKDTYHHNFTFTLHYQDAKKQLTTEDAASIRADLLKSLKTKFQASLVGKV